MPLYRVADNTIKLYVVAPNMDAAKLAWQLSWSQIENLPDRYTGDPIEMQAVANECDVRICEISLRETPELILTGDLRKQRIEGVRATLVQEQLSQLKQMREMYNDFSKIPEESAEERNMLRIDGAIAGRKKALVEMGLVRVFAVDSPTDITDQPQLWCSDDRLVAVTDVNVTS